MKCPCCKTDVDSNHVCNLALNNENFVPAVGTYSFTINTGGFLNGTYIVDVEAIFNGNTNLTGYYECICLVSPNIWGTVINDPFFIGRTCPQNYNQYCAKLKALSDNSTVTNL